MFQHTRSPFYICFFSGLHRCTCLLLPRPPPSSLPPLYFVEHPCVFLHILRNHHISLICAFLLYTHTYKRGNICYTTFHRSPPKKGRRRPLPPPPPLGKAPLEKRGDTTFTLQLSLHKNKNRMFASFSPLNLQHFMSRSRKRHSKEHIGCSPLTLNLVRIIHGWSWQ